MNNDNNRTLSPNYTYRDPNIQIKPVSSNNRDRNCAGDKHDGLFEWGGKMKWLNKDKKCSRRDITLEMISLIDVIVRLTDL